MSWAQKLVRLLPRKWAAAIEADSRQWVMACPCGHEVSVWDAGGVRYKAAGNPRRLRKCQQCGQRTWHKVVKKEAPEGQ